MKNYLCIRNEGVCDYRLFTLLGASTARGEAEKIGQFGSGAKHGALTLLRKGIVPIVKLGTDELTYYTEEIELHGKKQKQLGIAFKGEKSLQSMVLDFGGLDWQSPHMALREYVSNAIDAGKWDVTLEDDAIGVEGETRIYIPLDTEILEYYNNLSRYFLHVAGMEKAPVIPNLTEEKCRVYRKGVLVGSLAFTSCYHYNLDDIPLDESRNIKAYEGSYRIARYLVEEMDASKVVKAFLHGGPECFERIFSLSSRELSEARIAAFRAAWSPNHVIGCGTYTKHLDHLAQSRNLTIVHLGHSAYGQFKMIIPSLETITTSVVNGMITMPLEGNIAETWNSVWSFLNSRKLVSGPRPMVKMFRDSNIMSFVRHGDLFLNEHARVNDIIYGLETIGTPGLRDTMLNYLFDNQNVGF